MEPFTVTIRSDSPRHTDWMEMLGSDTVPVESPFTVRGNAPGQTQKQFYKLDLKQLTPEQRNRITVFMAKRFSLPVSEVCKLIDSDHGVPILADDVQPPAIDMRLLV